MPKIKSGETISQFAIRTAYEYGYLWHVPQSDIHKLKPNDPEVVAAMIAMSKMDGLRYTRHVLKEHGRQPDFDGVIGPAMEAMVLEGGRCPVPDIAPPPGVFFQFEDPYLQEVALKMQRNAEMAIGRGGNWPGCHGIGDFHCAAMRVNPEGMNPRVKPLWKQIMINVRKMYAGIGLLWKFIDMDGVDLLTGEQFTGSIQTDLTFVSKSAGWIGLAIVTTNESCGSRIWLKLLSTYVGGTTDAQIINQVGTLLAHEGGHNSGLQHTNGGIMAPTIQTGLPTDVWPESDRSTPILRSLYGGVPVPIPGGVPPVPPDEPEPTSLEKRVHDLEIQLAIQKVTLEFCVTKLRSMGG